MASRITVRIKYRNGSRSHTEVYSCADAHPSAEVVKDCEKQTLTKWEEMGHSMRGLIIDIRVN